MHASLNPGRWLLPVVIAWVACLWVPMTAALAADKAVAKPAEQTLPDPLTPTAIRELVARLGDSDVRALLIQQLDRTAAQDQARSASMMETVNDNSIMMRDRASEIADAFMTFPASLSAVIDRLGEPGGTGTLLKMVTGLGAMLLAGAVAEFAFVRVTRGWRERQAAQRREGFVDRTLQLGTRLGMDFADLFVFALAAVVLFFSLWQGDPARRTFVMGAFWAVVLTRAFARLARLLLAPAQPEERLLPLADAPAAALTRAVVWITALYSGGEALTQTFDAAGTGRQGLEVIGLANSLIIAAVAVVTIWRVRAPIGQLIRGNGAAGPLVRWIADLWPVAATAYVLLILTGVLWAMVAGTSAYAGAGIQSLMIIIVLPLIALFLRRALAAAAAKSAPPAGTGMVLAYESVLRKLIHIIVIVQGLVWIASSWHLSLFQIASAGVGARVASSMVGIGIVLLIGYMLWEITKSAIDRRMRIESTDDAETPASRLRTLLPLLRLASMIAILLMTTLSVLAALGVDILPLLAGASILGVAIGFGSQTLVRDIVSGAFYLADDAFRLGEYIEVGSGKGRVEKITVRSVFLRHHRGPLNIVPYGDIKQLRNNSRDWAIMVMEFRLAFDTDIKKVKKLMKTVSEEISAHPEYGPDVLQPLKSQGVISMDDSAIVVRAKYMVKPGSAQFMIRRYAYERILQIFHEEGIHIATRSVTVQMPTGATEEERAQAAAAVLPQLDAPGQKS